MEDSSYRCYTDGCEFVVSCAKVRVTLAKNVVTTLIIFGWIFQNIHTAGKTLSEIYPWKA